MAINLTTKFLPYTDELFSTESKKSLLTNDDFDWTGAHTVKVYKVGTSEMADYNRNPASGFTGSRYGTVKDLDATTEEFTLKKDRSFTFAIDKLDTGRDGTAACGGIRPGQAAETGGHSGGGQLCLWCDVRRGRT